MGITVMPTWAALPDKPQTVMGLGLSDFKAAAIAAQADAAFGGVGSYGMFICTAAPVAHGAISPGSSLLKINSASAIVSAGLSGTWRSMGGREDGAGALTSWLRIA